MPSLVIKPLLEQKVPFSPWWGYTAPQSQPSLGLGDSLEILSYWCKIWFPLSQHHKKYRYACLLLLLYSRPVLAFRYCHCLHLSVCVSMCLCINSWVCPPCENSSTVEANTTKVGQQIQNTMVKICIVNLGLIDLELQVQIYLIKKSSCPVCPPG